MARIETKPWDAAEFIKTPEDVAFYLEAVFEDGGASEIADALGIVARSKGMAQIAQKTGRSRESLYRALSAEGNPTLSTLVEVLEALGLRLSVAPIDTRAR